MVTSHKDHMNIRDRCFQRRLIRFLCSYAFLFVKRDDLLQGEREMTHRRHTPQAICQTFMFVDETKSFEENVWILSFGRSLLLNRRWRGIWLRVTDGSFEEVIPGIVRWCSNTANIEKKATIDWIFQLFISFHWYFYLNLWIGFTIEEKVNRVEFSFNWCWAA